MADRTRRKAAPSQNNPRPRSAAPSSNPSPAQAAPQQQPQQWETWLRLARQWLPVIGIATAAVAGLVSGLASALLVLAATSLLVAISAIWSSLQLVAGDSSESAQDVVLLAAPGTEYEQKHAVLRALKDLDYERAMGKISPEDYEELREQYRAKARAVLQTLDHQLEPVRAEAEKLVANYLQSRGIEAAPRPAAPPAAASSQAPQAPSPEPSDDPEEKARKCPKCSTGNDPDAAFCKKCGQRLDASERTHAGAEP